VGRWLRMVLCILEHALQASLVLLVGLRTVVGGTSLLALMVLYSRFGGPTHICSADIVGNTGICLSVIRVTPSDRELRQPIHF
jgi:hypothetical protein